ncbi:hypothetical protein [Aeromicrobium chenweiae]|uniref:hypothetical protein n=1 Tax=Aeromicrobium chenweiae TaxID=2079793 RepID=UPI00143D8D1C|nr:hypothetical protein [Aeromicrobium chenweiae]
MNVFLVVIGLLVVLSIVRLVRLVARDGLGTNPPPRSHPEELSSRSKESRYTSM